MYNYSLKLTYPNENDTVYRKELLEAFHLGLSQEVIAIIYHLTYFSLKRSNKKRPTFAVGLF